MIIVPSNVSAKKGPVVFGGAASAYAGTGASTLSISATVGSTVLYTAGTYQNDAGGYVNPSCGGQSLESYGTASGYGKYYFNGATTATAGGSISVSASHGSGYGHAAAWFTGAASVTALSSVTTANPYNPTVSCLEGEMLVILTAIPVGVGALSGGTVATRADYYTHGSYGGGAIRYAAGPTTVTFSTDSPWGMGNLVLLLKP